MSVSPAVGGLAFHALLHLLIFGALIRLAVAVVLRSPVLRSPVLRSPVLRSPVLRSPVLRSPAVAAPSRSHPRARYGIAVGGFLLAVCLPLLVQALGLWGGGAGDVMRYDEPAVGEASWWMGRSAEWPLLSEASGDVEAWWRWVSIGPHNRHLVTVWWSGLLLLSAGSAFGAWRFHRQQRQWTLASAAVCQDLGLDVGVALYTGAGGTPLATGLWRPRIYLPGWALTDLEPAALRRIVRHELAHVRWRDPLVDRGIRILRGLLWPAWPLWSLARVVRREREAAADFEALAPEAADREPKRVRIDYAETLLTVASRRRGLVPLVGAAGELEDRVGRLLQPPRRLSAWARMVPAALLVAGAAAVVTHPLPAGGAALAGPAQSGE
ncbi:MAG: M56 family metallopeptidase, partial [Acidobacteriota bacterium]